MAKLKKQINVVEKQLDAQTERLGEDGLATAMALETVMAGAAGEAEKTLCISLTAALRPDALESCRAIIESKVLNIYEAARALGHSLGKEAVQSGRVVTVRGAFIGQDGALAMGDILRIGNNSAWYMSDGLIGPLQIQPDSEELTALHADFPDWVHEDVTCLINGKGSPVPIDFSDGLLFDAAVQSKGLLSKLDTGGILVWPILAVGIVGLILGMERIIVMMGIRMDSDGMLQVICRLIPKDIPAALGECEKHTDSPVCRMLHAGLSHPSAPREVLEDVFHDAILKELPRLERFLPTLSMLAAIAPLLGLLGTVTGMINTFGVITMFGNGDPRLMSGGISEALITTQLGLAVAIPLTLLHHFLERRRDSIVSDMEEKSVALTVALVKAREKTA
ncbi:MotA/TolQ/ExbB proton channel family protein [Salidesulfovibrio brasiliensis]|uniref:MotA/TolQ/ExbB proton channel family protein n=1 Tax=Salidesulfovibrio brasiliensis TaxID=221711 RepID=UPI0006D249FA|nr:MotA/TolQ/ExbB proton channel family protein [Salidesulfovibrio brasiliensis]